MRIEIILLLFFSLGILSTNVNANDANAIKFAFEIIGYGMCSLSKLIEGEEANEDLVYGEGLIYGEDSIDKDSVDKDSVDKDSVDKESIDKKRSLCAMSSSSEKSRRGIVEIEIEEFAKENNLRSYCTLKVFTSKHGLLLGLRDPFGIKPLFHPSAAQRKEQALNTCKKYKD